MSHNYAEYTEHERCWTRRDTIREVATVAVGSAIIMAGVFVFAPNGTRGMESTHGAGSADRSPQEKSMPSGQKVPDRVSVPGCRQIEIGRWTCAGEDEIIKAKKVKKWYADKKTRTIKASVSEYTRIESCHNPKFKRDGSRECLTAAGHDARAGSTIACPSDLRLGTVVSIGVRRFVCDDRTATWVQRMYGPTFDIFTEDHAEAIRFGRQTLEVTIYE